VEKVELSGLFKVYPFKTIERVKEIILINKDSEFKVHKLISGSSDKSSEKELITGYLLTYRSRNKTWVLDESGTTVMPDDLLSEESIINID
jgi:hypothetical protein